MRFISSKELKIFIVLIIVLGLFPISSYSWWIFGGGKKIEERDFSYKFDSGGQILKMVPSWETKRVRKFESIVGCCPFRRKLIEDSGSNLLFLEMSEMGYENWWTIVVDIPSRSFLYIPKQSKIIMKAISKGDTIFIESQGIYFCEDQQSIVYNNSKEAIQIRPSSGFESTNFGKKFGGKYMVGYINFGKCIPRKDVLDFKPSKSIDVYPSH
jgi:hypothetical protein